MRRSEFQLFALFCGCLAASVGCSPSVGQGRRGAADMKHGDGGTSGGPTVDFSQCEGIACAVQSCGGGSPTSLSGTVFDPAGTTPLYNVSVYVPNAALADIPDGVNVTGTCTSCQAPLSGSPIVSVQTDSHGHFTLNNVPSGANIPVVFQTGKFRRSITIPNVTSCQDNPIGQKDSNGAEMLTRLPRSQAEGHLPLIAITTGGCEGLECVVRTYGFDDSEFTTSTGTGRIHLYTGVGGGKASGSTATSTEAYSFWGSDNMYKYDMILNSCECSPHPRDSMGPAYTKMQTYLDHGGRLFTSDYQYNWFTDTQAPAEFKAAAKWTPNMAAPVYQKPYFVDQTFPKGVALNDWLQFVFASNSPPPNGQISLLELFYNVTGINPGTTRWIYDTQNGMTADATASNYTSKYISFNLPFSAAATSDAGAPNQCGRAVFADIHVSGGIIASTFPTGCQGLTKNQQVTAFEFLFFDLGSCVQDDSSPPAPPPIQ
jgi:hypothetical protein